MQLINRSTIATPLVRQVLAFVAPHGVTGYAATVTDCSEDFRGRAWARRRWEVLLRVGPARRFPMRPGSKPPVEGKGYLPHPWLASREEALVFIAAHELRHLWQELNPRGRRVHGARGQFSERDADAYALRMLRAWRRRTEAAPAR